MPSVSREKLTGQPQIYVPSPSVHDGTQPASPPQVQAAVPSVHSLISANFTGRTRLFSSNTHDRSDIMPVHCDLNHYTHPNEFNVHIN